MQPKASLTTQVYETAFRFVATAVLCPLLHKYEYGSVPPITDTVAVPSLNPLQLITVIVSVLANTAGCVTVVLMLAVQPLASVTLKL